MRDRKTVLVIVKTPGIIKTGSRGNIFFILSRGDSSAGGGKPEGLPLHSP